MAGKYTFVAAANIKKQLEKIGITKVDTRTLADNIDVAITKSKVTRRIKDDVVSSIQSTGAPHIRRQIFHGLLGEGATGSYKPFDSTRNMFNEIRAIQVERTGGSIRARNFIVTKWGGNWYKYKASLTASRLASFTEVREMDYSIQPSYHNKTRLEIVKEARKRKKRGRVRVAGDTSRLQPAVRSYTIHKVEATQLRRPTPRAKDRQAEARQLKKHLKQGGAYEDFVYDEPEKLRRPSTRHEVYVDETLDITDKQKGELRPSKVTIASDPYKGRGGADGFRSDNFFEEQESLRSDFKRNRIEYPHRTARDTLIARHLRKSRGNTLAYSSRKGGKVYNVPYAKTGLLARHLSSSFRIIKADATKFDKAEGVFRFKVQFGLTPHKMPVDVREAWTYSKPQYKSVVIQGTSEIMQDYLTEVVSSRFGSKNIRN